MSLLKRKDIQLAEPFSESRLFNQGRYRSQWQPPWVIQPKLNGERCRAIVTEDKRVLLLSSTDSIISSVPHINQQMTRFPAGEYDGELYVHGWSFSEIHSVVSTTVGVHPRSSEMEYHIFDLVNSDIQILRLVKLVGCFNGLPHMNIFRVPYFLCLTFDEIMKFYDIFIDQKYEGFILREISSLYKRSRSQHMMKFKPKEEDIYDVLVPLEAHSENGKPLKMVGAFLCVDEMGTSFRVGAGKLPYVNRKLYWQMWHDVPFQNWKLRVEYQVLSDKNKVPHFSRAVEVII